MGMATPERNAASCINCCINCAMFLRVVSPFMCTIEDRVGGTRLGLGLEVGAGMGLGLEFIIGQGFRG
jgi:hypothetical protein